MISNKICCIFIILIVLKISKTQRKISGGSPVTTDKGYVVYLTKGSPSPRSYDYWICGGAIVSNIHVITSAACVRDIEYMYVIAGYKKYVPTDKINDDDCTKTMKKKVVLTCVPKLYELDYAKIEKWAYVDIAVVKVESVFNFDDENYTKLCSYKPKIIEVNYDPKYQEPNTDSMVFGWGHEAKWRKPDDTKDYNQDQLHYAATLIHDKKECKEAFSNFPELGTVIDKYMICTLDSGNLNDQGKLIKLPTFVDGCTPNVRLLAAGEFACEEDETVIDETRRSEKDLLTRITERQQMQRTRRQGICQNDHGGPLVTWVGAQEQIIGVASVFRVTNDSECSGPYLYTSTQCNGIFINCIITSGKNQTSRRLCDQPASVKGFDIIERSISWQFHPAGPAENEFRLRPQRPIRP